MRQYNEMLTLVQDNVVVNSAHDDMSLNTCNLCVNILAAKISVLRRNYKLNIFFNEMHKFVIPLRRNCLILFNWAFTNERATGQSVQRIQIL